MSSIIKSSFISFKETKKHIEVIDSSAVKVIGKPLKKEEEESNRSNDQDKEPKKFDRCNHKDKSTLALEKQKIEREIEEAKKQAAKIIESAKTDAKVIESQAYEKGLLEGYEDGKKQALEEQEQLRTQLEKEIQKYLAERQNIISEIEPKVAEIIKTLVENMIGIYSTDPNIILFIIRKGLEEIDFHGDLVLRVSQDDFEEVYSHQEEIMKRLTEKVQVEIIKDSNLTTNDCIIETKYGNIDCSLSSRIETLLNELELIVKSFEN